MSYKVNVTDDASQDLTEIYTYIAINDSIDNAEYVYGELKAAVKSLSESPNRGSYPRELSVAGIKIYREIYFKPYRIIYKVLGNAVNVLVIADGRRDMQQLLEMRLLG